MPGQPRRDLGSSSDVRCGKGFGCGNKTVKEKLSVIVGGIVADVENVNDLVKLLVAVGAGEIEKDKLWDFVGGRVFEKGALQVKVAVGIRVLDAE